MNPIACLRPVSLVAALLLTVVALPSCKEEVVLKTIEARLVTDLELDVRASDPLTGAWTQELDPDANSDVRDNRAKIKKIVVDRLTYKIDEFTGVTGTMGGGTWTLYPADDPSQVLTVTTVTGLDFAALKASGAAQEMPVSDEVKAKIVELINGRKKIVFAFTGNVSNKPTYARFELHLFTKIDVGL